MYGVLKLSALRISVLATEPASVCLDMAFKLVGTARENNAIAGKGIAGADHLPGNIGRIAA